MGNGLSSLATITQYWISDINSKWLRKFTVVLVPDMMSRLVGWILLLLVVVVCFFLWGGAGFWSSLRMKSFGEEPGPLIREPVVQYLS